MATKTAQVSTGSLAAPGFGIFIPPRDPLKRLFTPDVLQSWRRRPTEELEHRLNILSVCGPMPSEPRRATEVMYLRARKAAWDTYLYTAFACGMFEGERGNDLRARLTSRNGDNFRGAMTECQACWLFAGKIKLCVAPIAAGRNGRNLDLGLQLAEQEVGVEVKAPYRETPQGGISLGDDSDKIRQTLDSANHQFSDDRPNIIVLVPYLRWPLFTHRHDLLKAAFGQSKLTWSVNVQTGDGGPAESKFFPDGKFLNAERPGGAPLKPDGLPAYRRISLVLCVEESLTEKYPFPNPCDLLDLKRRSDIGPSWEHARDLHFSGENEARIEHNVLVVHNPHAYHQLGQEIWKDYPQLVPSGDVMIWTDGEEVVV